MHPGLPLLLFSLGLRVASADTGSLTSPPPAKPAPAPAVQLDPRVQGLLKGSVDFYAGLQSAEVDIDSVTRVQTPQMKNEMDSAFHVALQRPNFIAFIMKTGMMGGTFVSDGKTAITYEQALHKYTSGAAPATLEEALGPMSVPLIEGGLPLGFEAFFQKDALKGFEAHLQKSDYIGAEKLGDQPVEHVRLTTLPYVVDYWLAAGTQPFLLQTKVTPNMANVMKAISPEQKKKMPPGMESMTMTRTSTYAKWQVNPTLATSAFQFQPPPEAQRVDEFFTRPPHPLVGKMAPDFHLNDLAGKTVTLSSLRGKVVVLDFWATWCPPCVASLPVVTAVTGDRQAQGVVFFAINQKESADQARNFQKEKNLDFPVLLDSDGKVGELYQAHAIPESVVIDQEGKIEAVHVGYDANLKGKLGRQLDDLIAGKSLLKPDAATPAGKGA